MCVNQPLEALYDIGGQCDREVVIQAGDHRSLRNWNNSGPVEQLTGLRID